MLHKDFTSFWVPCHSAGGGEEDALRDHFVCFRFCYNHMGIKEGNRLWRWNVLCPGPAE